MTKGSDKRGHCNIWCSNSKMILLIPLRNICVTNDHGSIYVPLVVNSSRSFPHT